MLVIRFSWALLLIAGLLAGCTIPFPPCDLASLLYPTGAHLSGGSLRLGVISASRTFPFDLPGPLAETGAKLAVLDDVRWGFIEPQAPQDGVHAYEWDNETAALDTRVEEYQKAGFELVIVLRAWNTWARAVAPQGGQAAVAASTPPQAQYMADYTAWVAAVVERYDGDGSDDFPNLVDVDGDGNPDPVRYFQIEFEASNGVWWQGTDTATTVAEYLELLRAAATSARSAFPAVQILLAGIPALDLLDRFPTAAGLEDVVSNINPAVCGAIAGFAQTLTATDAYDIVAVHSAADYTGLPTLADWVATLAGNQTEVWITGATSAPALVGDPKALAVNPLFPIMGETLWASLENGFDSNHTTVETWHRAEQARLSFKKWVVAAWSGFDALVIGLEQDRKQLENLALQQRDLAFQGLLDQADGFDPPGQRPVIPALSLAQAQLGGYSGIEQLSGLGEGVYAFRFLVESLPVYALWYDDGVAQGPNDAPAEIQVQLPVHAPQLTAFTLPTTREQSGPDIEILTPAGGLLPLMLTETPIVLRGEWTAIFLPQVLR